MIPLPDGGFVRGAKKGGLTDHIAGMHLIPNVGREAMVPAECVRRAKPKPKPKPEPKPKPKPKPEPSKRKRRRGRSHSPRRDERRASSSSSGSSQERRPRPGPSGAAAEAEVAKPKTTRDEERLREQELQERIEEEKKKLQELEEARKKKQELEKARKKNLGGAFALTEEEEDEDEKRARQAQEIAKAEERRLTRERLALPPGESASSAARPVAQARLATSSDVLTAADIDGSQHDHQFSKVWKDWDATKKDDPGEIARQFMKITAIKRRGFGREPGARGERSRSRSRRR